MLSDEDYQSIVVKAWVSYLSHEEGGEAPFGQAL